MGRVVYFNGEMIPESEAKVSIYDSAMMFGDTVFEMTRSFNKKQFELDAHLKRLYASIKYVRIPLNMSFNEMRKHVYETIEANDHCFEKDDEHRIMINVTRGVLGIYQDVVGLNKGPNVIITQSELIKTLGITDRIFRPIREKLKNLGGHQMSAEQTNRT
jgi:branched-chain amino acid aminotransferase